MRVLVTGAAGLLGRYVVDALVEAGHAVHAIDRQKLSRHLALPSRASVADLATWRELDAAVVEAEAVVHLAAIPNLDGDPEETVFTTNTGLTARIAFAVIRAGTVRRFVYASSQSVLGLPLAPSLIAPDYLPVDEAHPCRPREGYGLSKQVGEGFCELIGQRLAIPAIAIRLPVIWAPETFQRHVAKRLADPVQAAKSLYAYVDARDAGAAFRLALEAEKPGYEVVQIGADRPFAEGDIRILAKQDYSAVEQTSLLEATSPLFSISRAECVLGYRPRYRWTASEITETPAR